MLNPPMKGWGWFELARQRAEETEPTSSPPATEINWAKGSMEWEAAQKAKLNGGS
jgi:hypothetical protein